MSDQISFDALLPPGMAAKAEDLGVKKANLKALNMFVLAILAGAFIGIGAIFATTVAARQPAALPLWCRPPAHWPCLYRRPDPGRRWWCRTVHRQHPDHHGLRQ